MIVGDLADPVEGGPCYQLYTKSFYELVVKPKLHDRGIFVTQAKKFLPSTSGREMGSFLSLLIVGRRFDLLLG